MQDKDESLLQSANLLQAGSDAGVRYLRTLTNRRVAPTHSALQGLSEFESSMPEHPSDPAKTLALLDRVASPATTATAAGRFFGLVVGGTLPASVGARALTTAWDQVVFNTATSAPSVKLEAVTAGWVLDLLTLPEDCSVGFVTGATMANFTCLAGARDALLSRQNWDVNTKGMINAPKLRIVASAEIHVTVLKALRFLGVGTDTIEYVPCDGQGRMDAAQMPELGSNTIVLCQAGNLNSGAFDPVAEICQKAKVHGAWVHVDGAFGLWAAASPQKTHLLEGYDAADSWVVDGHKWLNTPYECGLAITQHPKAVHNAMATQAPYLKSGGIAAPKDMVPEFSRAARGVEVWAALHSLGKSGVAGLIDQCCIHAQVLAKGLEGLGFEVLNDIVLNQVVAVIRGREGDMAKIATHVQNSGAAWFSTTVWKGTPAIRLSVSSWVTTEEDIDITLRAIRNAVAAINVPKS